MTTINGRLSLLRKGTRNKMRIGQSVDIHQLGENRDLILGGVKINHNKGLVGHSDADVLVHAITESLIGAMGLGDLGKHFPDTDPKYKGINSMLLLEDAYKMMEERNYEVVNIDATILAEQPKMAPHIMQMRMNVATALHTSVDNVNIKATRGEKMGFVGKEEGIMAMAVCLIDQKKGNVQFL